MQTFRQERRGRPGANTRYRRRTRTRFTISWELAPDRVAYDAAGVMPDVLRPRNMRWSRRNSNVAHAAFLRTVNRGRIAA